MIFYTLNVVRKGQNHEITAYTRVLYFVNLLNIT